MNGSLLGLATQYQGTIRNGILLVFGIGLLLLAVRSLRAQRLKERYVVLLIFTGLPFLTLAIWPDALALTAQWMGMTYHTLMVLCLAAFLILVIFELLSIVSVQERRIATLAQQVALLMQDPADRRGKEKPRP